MKIGKGTERLYSLWNKIRPQADVAGNERIQSTPSRCICFFGASSIGKSTLINALVADGISVVPAGGIGPFTAQVIVVKYGEKVSFEAEYHSKDVIHKFIAGFAKTYDSLCRTKQKAKVSALNKHFSKDVLQQIGRSRLDNRKEQKTLRQESIKQASLLITGNQESCRKIEYLIDGLQTIIDGNIIFGSRLNSEDAKRINVIKAVMRKGKFECKAGEISNYSEYLKFHATGFLAPIVKSFRVRVKSELLEKGLVLVDLPGVGVDGDVHQKVTRDYLTSDADAAVLVISTRGIGDSEHRIMKIGGIYARMFSMETEKRSRPFDLVIAVTRVDDIAYSRFSHYGTKKKWQHFAEVCTETENEVRKQLKELLKEEWISLGRNNQPANIVDGICRRIEIVPVSAVEFRKLRIGNSDDRPFITNERQSNIPRLRKILSAL